LSAAPGALDPFTDRDLGVEGPQADESAGGVERSSRRSALARRATSLALLGARPRPERLTCLVETPGLEGVDVRVSRGALAVGFVIRAVVDAEAGSCSSAVHRAGRRPRRSRCPPSCLRWFGRSKLAQHALATSGAAA
jgi:hypothetical protein